MFYLQLTSSFADDTVIGSSISWNTSERRNSGSAWPGAPGGGLRMVHTGGRGGRKEPRNQGGSTLEFWIGEI